jgi:hypothetical protein
MRVYLICDSRGKVVGTAPVGVQEVKTSLPGTGVSKEAPEEEVLQVHAVPEPLPGQTIHEVDLPPELEALEEGSDFVKAVSEYRIEMAEVRLVRR